MALHSLAEHDALWQQFFSRFQLTVKQQEQFRRYYQLLVETNVLHNLTAITDLEKALADHFEDSLMLGKFVDLSTVIRLGDIGTGAGFPALPLKIAYPALPMLLIEVNHKKISFLEQVIGELGLTDVIISDLDWRTFLRKTDYEVDLFCARASLQPEELVRMFMPSSAYRGAQLVYWASRHWEPSPQAAPYVYKQVEYQCGNKLRRLIFSAILDR